MGRSLTVLGNVPNVFLMLSNRGTLQFVSSLLEIGRSRREGGLVNMVGVAAAALHSH